MSTLTIELPEAVTVEVRRMASERGVSPEVYLAELAMLHAGDADAARTYLAGRAARADWAAFERVFGADRQGGGEPPRPGDEAE